MAQANARAEAYDRAMTPRTSWMTCFLFPLLAILELTPRRFSSAPNVGRMEFDRVRIVWIEPTRDLVKFLRKMVNLIFQQADSAKHQIVLGRVLR